MDIDVGRLAKLAAGLATLICIVIVYFVDPHIRRKAKNDIEDLLARGDKAHADGDGDLAYDTYMTALGLVFGLGRFAEEWTPAGMVIFFTEHGDEVLDRLQPLCAERGKKLDRLKLEQLIDRFDALSEGPSVEYGLPTGEAEGRFKRLQQQLKYFYTRLPPFQRVRLASETGGKEAARAHRKREEKLSAITRDAAFLLPGVAVIAIGDSALSTLGSAGTGLALIAGGIVLLLAAIAFQGYLLTMRGGLLGGLWKGWTTPRFALGGSLFASLALGALGLAVGFSAVTHTATDDELAVYLASDDEEERKQAFEEAQKRLDASAIPWLTELLKAESPHARRAAATMLSKLATEEGGGTLLPLARSLLDPALEAEATDLLRSLGPPAAPALRQLLEESPGQPGVVRLLAEIDPRDAQTRALVRELASSAEAPADRAWAHTTFNRMAQTTPAGVHALYEARADPAPEVQAVADELFGPLKSQPQSPGPDGQAFTAHIQALKVESHSKSTAAIVAALDPFLRRDERVLRMRRHKVLALVEQEGFGARVEVLRVLLPFAQHLQPEAGRLLRLLLDDDDAVSLAALGLLTRIKPSHHYDRSAAVQIRALKDLRPHVHEYAAELLSKVPPDFSRGRRDDLLSDLLGAPAPRVRPVLERAPRIGCGPTCSSRTFRPRATSCGPTRPSPSEP